MICAYVMHNTCSKEKTQATLDRLVDMWHDAQFIASIVIRDVTFNHVWHADTYSRRRLMCFETPLSLFHILFLSFDTTPHHTHTLVYMSLCE